MNLICKSCNQTLLKNVPDKMPQETFDKIISECTNEDRYYKCCDNPSLEWDKKNRSKEC